MKWSNLRSFVFLSLVLWTVAIRAEVSPGHFIVEVVSDRSKIVCGDSCLISCVLYASYPFVVKEYPKTPKLRHNTVRAVTERGNYLQRGMRDNQVVYYVVAQQYVVRTKLVKNIVIPEMEYEVELQIPREPQDPFEMFFGSQRPPEKVRTKAKSHSFEVKVVEKPQRTMKQMMDSGLEIL